MRPIKNSTRPAEDPDSMDAILDAFMEESSAKDIHTNLTGLEAYAIREFQTKRDAFPDSFLIEENYYLALVRKYLVELNINGDEGNFIGRKLVNNTLHLSEGGIKAMESYLKSCLIALFGEEYKEKSKAGDTGISGMALDAAEQIINRIGDAYDTIPIQNPTLEALSLKLRKRLVGDPELLSHPLEPKGEQYHMVYTRLAGALTRAYPFPNNR